MQGDGLSEMQRSNTGRRTNHSAPICPIGVRAAVRVAAAGADAWPDRAGSRNPGSDSLATPSAASAAASGADAVQSIEHGKEGT